MLKILSIIVLTSLIYIAESFAATSQFYSSGNLEKIASLIAIALIVLTPKKSKVVVIGTVGGLILAYLTYKYVIPIIL